MNVKKSRVWGATLALASLWLYSRRAASYARLHPDLRAPLLRFRWPSTSSAVVKVARHIAVLLPEPTDAILEARRIPGPAGAPDISVYIYHPGELRQPAAALLYIHGGGYMVGAARVSHATCARFARELGIVVINTDYRLAPEAPFPAPLEDCYAVLHWMKQQADSLGIDPERIAVGGESAGAGLAAALAQLAHDRGEVEPAFQLLVYPMLDDRTVLERDHAGRGEFLWTPGSNRMGWTSYLGQTPTIETAPAYAAPARRQDLAGLAPAWIGVGTLDLFYPENKAYAQRLNEAGVPCEFYEVEGAYHGFDSIQPGAPVSAAFLARSMAALRRGLRLE